MPHELISSGIQQQVILVTLSASAYWGSFDSEQCVFKNNSIAEFRKTHKLKTYLSTCPNDIFEIYFAY